MRNLKLDVDPKYQKDLNDFNKALDLASTKLRPTLEALIKEFKNQTSLINEEHASYTGYINPKKTRESIDRLARVRWQLYQILKDLNIR